MTCAEANQVDLVDYLESLGYRAKKIKRNDYWYLSPLRDEREASFKVNRIKNVWYDHGSGKGGSLLDFAKAFYNCDISSVLEKLSDSGFGNGTVVSRTRTSSSQTNSVKVKTANEEPGIQIITAVRPVSDLRLCRYVRQRRIDQEIAAKYLHEVRFKNGQHDTVFKALGFKNSSGGFELRNEYFKASSSPKDIFFADNGAKILSVFEGFFDFLSYLTITNNQQMPLINYLVLNSLSFFEKSLPLMCSHQSANLYLDQDGAGKRITEKALSHSDRFYDQSVIYKGYKDLNEWTTNFGRASADKSMRIASKKP